MIQHALPPVLTGPCVPEVHGGQRGREYPDCRISFPSLNTLCVIIRISSFFSIKWRAYSYPLAVGSEAGPTQPTRPPCAWGDCCARNASGRQRGQSHGESHSRPNQQDSTRCERKALREPPPTHNGYGVTLNPEAFLSFSFSRAQRDSG